MDKHPRTLLDDIALLVRLASQHAARDDEQQRLPEWHEVRLLSDLDVQALIEDAAGRAREAGVTWRDLADAARMASPQAARYRLERSVREQHASRRSDDAPREQKPLPGISVVEAARREGVKAAAIYGRVQRRSIQSVRLDDGTIRVTEPRLLRDGESVDAGEAPS